MKPDTYQRYATKALSTERRFVISQQHGGFPGSYKAGKFKRATKKGKK